MNVEQIIAFFSREGKDAIYPLYEEMLQLRKEIEAQPNMSQLKTNSLMRKTENLKRRFEKEFNWTDAEKWMN